MSRKNAPNAASEEEEEEEEEEEVGDDVEEEVRGVRDATNATTNATNAERIKKGDAHTRWRSVQGGCGVCVNSMDWVLVDVAPKSKAPRARVRFQTDRVRVFARAQSFCFASMI